MQWTGGHHRCYPLAFTSIDESHDLIPYHKIFVDGLCSSTEGTDAGVEDEEETQWVDQDIMSYLENYFEKYSFKENIKYSIFKSSLIFEVIITHGAVLRAPHVVLKQDHSYYYAKCFWLHVLEGSRRDPHPYNQWHSTLLKQYKRKFFRLCAYWGMSHPKLACFHRRPRSTKTKKKIVIHVRDRFGLKIPRSTREDLPIDKENNNNFWLKTLLRSKYL